MRYISLENITNDMVLAQNIKDEFGRVLITKGAKLTTKKSVASKEVILKHSKDFNGSLSDDDCIKLASISRNSYYKYKAELKQQV